MSYTLQNPEECQLVGTIRASFEASGRSNIGWGAINTEKQRLNFNFIGKVYQLISSDQSAHKDYYMLCGNFYHGITGSPDNPSTNWVSVGYYANYMELAVRCDTLGAEVLEFGPNSTVEQATIGFSIGGSAEAGADGKKPKGGIGINGGASFSFTAQEVSFACRPSPQEVAWRVRLPGVGWVSPAVPANPAPPSYAGYAWNPGIIFVVPQGAQIKLSGSCKVEFEFNYTRGITNDTKGETRELIYTPSEQELALEAHQERPTILEALRREGATQEREGRTDSFLQAIEQVGLVGHFNDNSSPIVVFAPSNRAIKSYFQDMGATAAKYTSVFSNVHVQKFLEERIFITSPEKMERLPSMISNEGVEVIPCRDGLLVISDYINPSSAFSDLEKAT